MEGAADRGAVKATCDVRVAAAEAGAGAEADAGAGAEADAGAGAEEADG